MSEEHSKNKLANWGLKGTLMYLVLLFGGMLVLWFYGFLTMEPLGLNEVGDFLAGAFGPLAIFWLVLGFFQQGHELRLQVRELALSVEQQKELVGVTRETLDHERNIYLKNEIKRQEELWPKFSFNFVEGDMNFSVAVKGKLEIKNVGADISEVSAYYENRSFDLNSFNFDYWPNGTSYKFNAQVFNRNVRSKNSLTIQFKNADGHTNEMKFQLSTSLLEPFDINVSRTNDITN